MTERGGETGVTITIRTSFPLLPPPITFLLFLTLCNPLAPWDDEVKANIGQSGHIHTMPPKLLLSSSPIDQPI